MSGLNHFSGIMLWRRICKLHLSSRLWTNRRPIYGYDLIIFEDFNEKWLERTSELLFLVDFSSESRSNGDVSRSPFDFAGIRRRGIARQLFFWGFLWETSSRDALVAETLAVQLPREADGEGAFPEPAAAAGMPEEHHGFPRRFEDSSVKKKQTHLRPSSSISPASICPPSVRPNIRSTNVSFDQTFVSNPWTKPRPV